MKILKIFGIVVGIHVFALVLIFANPGCSSSTKPAPTPADTAAAPTTSAPSAATTSAPTPPAAAPAPLFNPDAAATSATGGSSGSGASVRFTPTRPGSPIAPTPVAEPVADVMPATTYTVKSGDSLWTIAKKHNLTVAQLTAANNLPTNAVLKANQKLLIPGKPSSPIAAATANPAVAQGKTAETVAPKAAPTTNGAVKHTVKSGETLGAIARTYGVKPGDIAVANNISDPAKIRAGMELVIPGWEAPASKSGKQSGAKSAPASKSTPPPTVPAAPPTINFDAPSPSPTPPPSSQPNLVPVIPIEEAPVTRPAPKSL